MIRGRGVFGAEEYRPGIPRSAQGRGYSRGAAVEIGVACIVAEIAGMGGAFQEKQGNGGG